MLMIPGSLTTVYAVQSVMDCTGHTVSTTITPLPYHERESYHPRLLHYPPYVARVEYFFNYNDVLRSLKGAAQPQHRLARAFIRAVEALAGVQ